MADDFVIERMYIGSIDQSNALNAIKDRKCNQKAVAGFYADCLRSAWNGQAIDFQMLNGAILKRWPKGLERIKERAWKEAMRA